MKVRSCVAAKPATSRLSVSVRKKFLLANGARRKRFCGTTAKDLVAILDPELCDQRDVAPLDIAMEAARSLMKRYESTF